MLKTDWDIERLEKRLSGAATEDHRGDGDQGGGGEEHLQQPLSGVDDM